MDNNIKILRASAGSGKTYRLAYEYIKRVIKDPLQYSKILAVTFTNKATEEMKNRILARLNDLSEVKIGEQIDYLDQLINDCELDLWQIKENARRAKSYILHDYSNFAVSTIDKFFQRIARSFFKELNLEFNYEVELSQDTYIAQAVERVLEEAENDRTLKDLIANAIEEQLENNSWDIRQKLVKIAQVLTKEGYPNVDKIPNELIGLLEKAKEKLNLLKIETIEVARTACSAFEGAGLNGVDFAQGARGFACQIERIREGYVEKGYNSYFVSAAESVENWASKTSKNKTLIKSLEADLMPLMHSVKANVDKYIYLNNGIKAVQKNFSIFLILDYISIQLDKIWGENNKLPIFRTTDLIADITNASDAPFIYEKIGAYYNCYMIDEFQDTSNKQWQGFKPLIEEALGSSESENVMLIGDVKQAIYRWRGGDWNILANQVENDFVERVNDRESLTTNYRSCDKVIEFNNSLFEQILKNETQNAKLINNAYKECKQQKTGKNGGYVEINFSLNNGNDILNRIENLIQIQKYQQKDIAILTRYRAESAIIANLLVNNGFSVISDEALLLNNSKIIRFMVAMMKLSVDIENVIAIAQVNLFLEKGMQNYLDNIESKIVNQIANCNAIKALEVIIKQYKLEEQEVAYLQAFYDCVYRFCVGISGDVGQFVEWWNEKSETLSLAVPKGQNAITIITIHKAKGLQFPIVLLPYADWSMMPKKDSKMWAKTDEKPLSEMKTVLVNFVKDLENSPFQNDYKKELIYSYIDNLNLLYVALTRAEQELYVFIDKSSKNDNTIAAVIKDALNRIENINVDDENRFYVGLKETSKLINKEIQNILVADKLKIENAELRIATKLPYYRLEDQKISNREMGIIMHNLFARIKYEKDFVPQIELMKINGEISSEMATKLEQKTSKWINNEIIKDWFSDKWEVFSERSILAKNNVTWRPDRVLVKGERVIVIDYKFGENIMRKHEQQVINYTQVMKQMGYGNIQSYIWYVTLDRIVEL